MKKKLVIGITVITIISLCGYFLKTKYVPWSFVNSFFEQLEFEGAVFVDNDFFISKSYATPTQSWKDYYNNYRKWNGYYINDSLNNRSINSLYNSWKRKYLSNALEYIRDNKSYSEPNILTFEKFTNTFGKSEFSNVDLAYIEAKNNQLIAVAYSNVKSTNQNEKYSSKDKYKLKLIALHGKYGWKITYFNIDNF